MLRALAWRIVIRHFVQLRRALLHIGLHLLQQLPLFGGQLSFGIELAAGRRFGRGLHADLPVFQLFDVAPALFRLRRQAVAGARVCAGNNGASSGLLCVMK